MFQFRLEATNVFNIVNLINPGTSLDAPATFGKIRSARNMRQIQLGVRCRSRWGRWGGWGWPEGTKVRCRTDGGQVAGGAFTWAGQACAAALRALRHCGHRAALPDGVAARDRRAQRSTRGADGRDRSVPAARSDGALRGDPDARPAAGPRARRADGRRVLVGHVHARAGGDRAACEGADARRTATCRNGSGAWGSSRRAPAARRSRRCTRRSRCSTTARTSRAIPVWQKLTPAERDEWRSLLDVKRFYDPVNRRVIDLAENYLGVAARVGGDRLSRRPDDKIARRSTR